MTAKPISFSWSDLDQLPGGEQGDVQENNAVEQEDVQVPNSGEFVHSDVLSEKVPEERTYRNLRGNPRFMYANVRDPPMLKSYFANSFESPKAYSTKITVGNALKTSDAAEWIAAMKTEMDQMMETGTLEATKMSDVFPNSSIINSTMVLVQKPEKKKARLRGKIADLFSSTIGALTYSTVHQIYVIDRMRVRIIDTVGAYLYQVYFDTSPTVYIRIPVKVMDALKIPADTVYKIKNYIYGLPDSGRAYYLAYAKLLQDAGYKKAKSNPCLFFKISAIFFIYVAEQRESKAKKSAKQEILYASKPSTRGRGEPLRKGTLPPPSPVRNERKTRQKNKTTTSGYVSWNV